MEMRVEGIPNYRLAYVRQTGPYCPGNVQAMEHLKRWAKAKGLLTESAILFGIPQDHPQTTLPEHCRYDACIVISEDTIITEDDLMNDGVCESEFIGGDYVVFKIRHTAEAMQRAWADIFPAVHSLGYQVDNKPIVEKYTGYDLLHRNLCEICVPIKSI
ncbi:AraC family transcriptional regulator [Paenibacillus chibensis]|uniref:AraC family transcriptional regulator n=1 Tax=Paenibacillus chibensis TaxID=59846 RepID=UPI000FDB1E8B|nr:GyrI-like domain-containing protein [Paenibacillus chibensis]MEC0370570.1 GyrI-like domain-containing protein [Paenibacillus chibensis]